MSSRDKLFNRIAMVITIVLAIVALWFVTASAAELQCPAGSYDAGGFCKNEPTGCPYGDSIPLDSPKCAPSPEEEIQLAENGNIDNTAIAEPVTPAEDNWGK